MVTGLYWRSSKDGNGFKLMAETDEHDELMTKLKEFDSIYCPRCGDGVSTDDEEGIEAFTLFGLPTLVCPFCFLEYSINVYLETDDDD
jgi:hypothetical protein